LALFTQTRTLANANRKEVKRFVKFATVGAANPIGFSAAVLQNFFLNRRWTFPESQQRNAGRQLVQFAIVSIIGLIINQLVFVTVDHLLEPIWLQLVGQPRVAHALSYNSALAVAIGVVLFWNFTANRLWTYRGLSRQPQ
jgi:putative flippase GtrA